MTIEYMKIKVQKLDCKLVGSIKIDKKSRHLFTKSEAWSGIVKSMGVEPSVALKNGLPSRIELSQEDRADMQTYFYDAVINAIYPDAKSSPKSPFDEISIYKIVINKDIQLLANDADSCTFVENITFYNYPHGITLFAIDMQWENITLNDFTKYISILRDVEHYARKNYETKEQKTVVADQFLSLFNTIIMLYNQSSNIDVGVSLNDYSPSNVCKYINFLHKSNKLKSYVTIRLTSESDAMLSNDYSRKHLLYDVATMSRIGSAVDVNSEYKPSDAYFNKLMSENLIDCFDNWSALSLVDTFCCIMSPFPAEKYDFQYVDNWGKYYFEYLYLNVLYIKIFMLDANDRFIADKSDSKQYDAIRDIDRTFNHYNVSYNFLPDMVYKKIRAGMEIDDELQVIKVQIENHENREEHKREKCLNKMIFVLTIFTLFSVFNDGWEFIRKIIELFCK